MPVGQGGAANKLSSRTGGCDLTRLGAHSQPPAVPDDAQDRNVKPGAALLAALVETELRRAGKQWKRS